MNFVELIAVYTVGSVTGIVWFIGLAISWVFYPSAFSFKKRHTPPKCLTDPAYGNHGFLSLKDIRIHYVENGDKSRPLMLFLHGSPEFWYSWRYQIKEFSKDYWTVAIDMRGFGESGKPHGISSYTLDKISEDIKQVVEALGRQKFVLVAHDWGGVAAWIFLRKYSKLVDKYIILSCPYTPVLYNLLRTNITQILKSIYVCLFQLPYLPELLVSSFDFGTFKFVFRDKRFKFHPTISDEDIEAYKYNYKTLDDLTPTLNYYRAYFWTKSDLEKQLDIEAPGLYMIGELDRYVALDNLKIAKKYVKNLVINMVKGASHFVQQDDPKTVNKYIREFLENKLS